MSTPTDIKCPQCDEVCGKSYPATSNGLGGPGGYDPPFDEGIGENFTDDEGNWYCSQKCLDEHDKEQEEE